MHFCAEFVYFAVLLGSSKKIADELSLKIPFQEWPISCIKLVYAIESNPVI